MKDLVVQYYDKNISTIDLLKRLNMSFARFDVEDIKCPSLEYSCETVCPLDNESRERMSPKTCYCDTLCLELGDCCYDYFSRLVAKIILRVMTIPLNLDTENNLSLSILQNYLADI